VPAIDGTAVLTVGRLEVHARNGFRTQAGRDPEPILEGFVPEQPVDLHALGLAPVDEGVADSQALAVTHELAPFPVEVDRRTGTTVPTTVALPADTLPVEVGTRVL